MKSQNDSEKKLGPTEIRRQRFVEGLVDGKSMYQAALDAGYAETTAKVACRDIMPQCRDIFRQAMHHRISVGKLSDTIAAGLDAKEVKVFSTKDGGIVYSEPLIAWGERRQYSELAAKLMALEPERRSDDEQTGNITIQVVTIGRPIVSTSERVDVTSLAERLGDGR